VALYTVILESDAPSACTDWFETHADLQERRHDLLTAQKDELDKSINEIRAAQRAR
jgi:hypothetical protein